MQRTLNQRIKKRESFRPFAPAVLAERADEWFELQDIPSPYMLFTAAVRDGHRSHADACDPPLLASALDHVASDIPAVTHVDGSARVQTVSRESNPAFWAILAAFERRTGCPVLVNTSFNVRGEPVVCTPEDAYRSFLWTDVDHLVLGSWLLTRSEQPDAGEAARAPAHLAD
jgi:carbamoyltransferase